MSRVNISFYKITINLFETILNSSFSVLEACKYTGFHIPRFCYHELLSIAGNCRMCLVELSNSVKPLASCVTPLTPNMVIFLDTPLVLKARENVLESLLLNHPLDCPICDQGGECDLQDQAFKFGSDISRYNFKKRGVKNKTFNSLVSTIMTRCIHCTRCIRYSSEIIGIEGLGLLNRGSKTEVGNYTSKIIISEIMGNIIDLCPVGALTSKVYSFKSRAWELRTVESVDLTDAFGSNSYINYKDESIFRIIPKPNKDLNLSLLTDPARYFFDSLQSQRLFNIFVKTVVDEKSKLIKYNGLNLTELQLFKQNSIILVDETLSFEVLNLFKLLNYNNPTIKICSFVSGYLKSNFFISNFKNNTKVLENSNIIFLLSSNLKVENAILNSKIRLKFIKEDLQIYKLVNNFSSNYLSTCLNLNINFLLLFLEGKHKILSNLLISVFFKPLFIFSENLQQWGLNVTLLENLIVKLNSNCKFIYNVLKCNSVSLSFLGIANLTKKNIQQASFINIINFKETLGLFKVLEDGKSIAWWNTHGPTKFTKISKFLIPILPYVYEKGLYINFEQRAQLVNPLFSEWPNSTTRYAFSLKNEIEKLVTVSSSIDLYIDFYKNIIVNNKIFDFKKKFYFNNSIYSTFVSLLPVKLACEDIFTFSKLSKNSKILSLCSLELRKEFKVFSHF